MNHRASRLAAGVPPVLADTWLRDQICIFDKFTKTSRSSGPLIATSQNQSIKAAARAARRLQKHRGGSSLSQSASSDSPSADAAFKCKSAAAAAFWSGSRKELKEVVEASLRRIDLQERSGLTSARSTSAGAKVTV